MAYTAVALATQTNTARHGQDGTARLLNCYAEDTGSDAKAQSWTIYPNAGLDLWNTVQTGGFSGGVRAMIATEQYLYVVAGRVVSAINILGQSTVLLTLSGDGPVYLAKNRRQPTPEVCLVSDGVARLFTGLSVSTITDPDLPSPLAVSVSDGYFLFPAAFDRVFISAEDNGSSISSLDFGRAQRKPDATIFALGAERDVAVFGDQSVEIWRNSPDGTVSFPYTPVETISIGCKGAKTIAVLDRAIAWYASDGTIRMMDGYSGKVISTYSISRKLSTVRPSEITAFGWNEPDTGHAFLAWRSPSFTLVYNLRTGTWHERESYGRTSWRGGCAVEWRGKVLIGDAEDGRIYENRADVHTEGGEPIVMTCIPPSIHQAPGRFILDEIAIDAVTGTGSVTVLPHDSDPVVMLSVSQDGGKTFGVERHVRMGKAGERMVRLREHRFGRFGPHGATLKLSVSAAVARAFMGIGIRARPLA